MKKSYGKKVVLDSLSFSLEEGKALGIVGQNSSGKTTLLKILATIIKPDSGKLFLFGKNALKDFRDVRREVAFVPEFPSLVEEISIYENLLFFSHLKRTHLKEDIIVDLMLEPFLDTIVQNASKGVKQRTAIAVALLGEPKLLILDEPTSGLDSKSTEIVRNLLKKLKKKGVTMVVSSHIKEDIEGLCDVVLSINNEHKGD
ncbi:ABC transporter ATP-binding protein [Thermotoga sp. KOL6]|uniref:ABC transporter ATP-binding protein n=1 Tax=Thermotoga sp. KOL6 TaxID=126741 RepID=UPI000C78EE5C|nr:ABC transporter ATP-binding protein [Thermotoga sp. KOL6]PLV60496.1 ABC transporter ATP-binding protein [Thermotoga sp. KOL6]